MTEFVLGRAKTQAFKTLEEYFNNLRVNIQFSGSDIRVIAVSSVKAGEGKSTTSANLAISFAQAGYKTLLVDADIRNSVMTGTFKAEGAYHGLTSYLSGHVASSEIISQTNIANLDIIPAGQTSPNPVGLLQNNLFTALIENLRAYYDYIIIDTAPIGLVVDAAIVAQRTDGVAMVVETGVNSRRHIKKHIEQLEQSGSQFLGIILNKVDAKKEKYGVYGTYGSYDNSSSK